MTLRIKFDPEYEEYLKTKYEATLQYTSDVGFDLYLPCDLIIQPFETKFINLGIRTEYQLDDGNYSGYHLYPRSSISKTKIRLANSVGIIDPNYRGNLIAAVDNISNEIQILKQGERYFQLVFVRMDKLTKVEMIDELSITDRGTHGFGSTGK
jgi:dUTP pyrophosphatase